MSDPEDAELRTALERFIPMKLDTKERLNKVQVAFFLVRQKRRERKVYLSVRLGTCL